MDMENLWENAISLIYPRRCPICHDIVQPRGKKICPACRRKVHFIEQPTCKKCGTELESSQEELCPDCKKRHRSFDGGISLMLYDKIARESMTWFKYHGRQEYAAWYIEEILYYYRKELLHFRAEAIIPVPVHKSRLRERGYNQAELLGRELSRGLGIPLLPRALLRTKKTVAQKELTPAERLRNMESSMQAGTIPQGIQRVILVDDIYTTGSTAEVCTRVLNAAGITHVFLVTVCVGETRA